MHKLHTSIKSSATQAILSESIWIDGIQPIIMVAGAELMASGAFSIAATCASICNAANSTRHPNLIKSLNLLLLLFSVRIYRFETIQPIYDYNLNNNKNAFNEEIKLNRNYVQHIRLAGNGEPTRCVCSMTFCSTLLVLAGIHNLWIQAFFYSGADLRRSSRNPSPLINIFMKFSWRRFRLRGSRHRDRINLYRTVDCRRLLNQHPSK